MDNSESPIILFISDVHCQYDLINVQIDHAEARNGMAVSNVLVLGDLGFFEPVLRKFFRHDGKQFKRKTSFIEGNHEDYHDLLKWSEFYSEKITHLPRNSIQTIDGYRFLCLGGTAYMDAMMTPESAEIHDSDIDRCLGYHPDDVDIIITHDCPSGIGVPNTPGFEIYGEPGFPRSSELITHFHPKLWIFGHHHKWFESESEGTRFIGLPESWNGYGMLMPDYQWISIHNPLGKPMGFWEKLRCTIVRKFR